MHVCIGVVTCLHLCSCAFLLHAPVCLCQVAMLLKKGRSWDGMCFCVFLSTYLLSLIIHDVKQRNELDGLGRKDGLQQNQCLDFE